MTTSTDEKKLLLGSPRVLDLTDETGFLCGRILADLGADVIKIERPGGDASRRVGPFYGDRPDPEKSLYWFAFNANKRGITLDLETGQGREILAKLIAAADFVIESFKPGYLEALGLGYAEISRLNPWLIMTSITPFGQVGPYRDYQGPDIVCVAMSGWMFRMGDPDRAPVRVSVPQAYLNAGAEAAAGTMMAYYHREKTGQAQHVDVSIRESLVPHSQTSPAVWELNHLLLRRVGPYLIGLGGGKIRRKLIWSCRDGFVAFIVFGGMLGAATNSGLVRWMESAGMADDYLRNMNWEAWDMAKNTQTEIDHIEKLVSEFFLTRSKKELYEEALKRRIMLMPVSGARDIMDNAQLQARGFWDSLSHPELETRVQYPGIPFRTVETLFKIGQRAPLIGEHNREIYETELGFTAEGMDELQRRGVI